MSTDRAHMIAAARQVVERNGENAGLTNRTIVSLADDLERMTTRMDAWAETAVRLESDLAAAEAVCEAAQKTLPFVPECTQAPDEGLAFPHSWLDAALSRWQARKEEK